MKKKKKIEDYPIEDASMEDVERLLNRGWIIDCQKYGEIKMVRENKAGMLSVKFLKVKGK